jgi:hypothetical protein
MQTAFPVVLFGSIGLFVLVGVLSMLNRNNLYDQIGQGGMFMNEDQEHTALRDGVRPGPPGGGGFGGLGAGGEADGFGGGLEAGGLGAGGLGPGGPEPLSAGGRAERDQEIRQLLRARSDRLVRQGHEPLDIDAELARLQMPEPHPGESHDSALAAEVRGLVHARNERRQRRGLEALDVETEVRRTLAELDPN